MTHADLTVDRTVALGADRPSSTSIDVTEQHSLARSVALHLGPGVAGVAALVATGPLLASAGMPPLLAFYGPMTLTVIAVELGYLLTKRGSSDLAAVIDYRRRLPAPRLALLAIGLILLGLILTGLAGVADALLGGSVVGSLPSWWVFSTDAMRTYPKAALAGALLVGLVLNGFVGPIVEEAYFRGHLLPRLSRFGGWAPVISAGLFSLYHFWQPWAVASRFGYVLPYTVAVQRTRSIYVGIVVHCAGNLLGIAILAAALLA